MYPPVPLGPPRLVPENGANVCGTFLPAGVSARGLFKNSSDHNIDLLLRFKLCSLPL